MADNKGNGCDKARLRWVPFEDSPDLRDAVKRGCKIRGGQNWFFFILRRVKNYILGLIAYFCPVNSIRVFCHRCRGVNIGKNVLIGFHCVLDHSFPEYITIEDDAALAGDVYLLAHSCPPRHFKGELLSYLAPVHIHKGAWLGIRATVLPGVSIGKNSIVSAGSVVCEDVSDGVIVQGNPAVVIKRLKNAEAKEKQ
ncbi:MAG: acyltransferase [Planctomycetota bacterium]|jgi:acetyltransferase-like isoleucine patch superfamily enzyme